MIEKYREGLFEIYERAPIYGAGKTESLSHQFSLYRNILREVGAIEIFQAATVPLIVQSKAIETLITSAGDEAAEQSQANFECALKLLSNDIFTLLEILKFTAGENFSGLRGRYSV